MTTITQTPATDIEGASAPATVEAAKDAATVKRTPRQHKPAADKGAPKAPARKEMGEKAAPKAAKGKGASKAAPSGKAALYFIATGRPASGAMLHAHTEAFMTIYGMHKGAGAPLSTARAVMGATAVNYHKQNARFEVRDGKVFLTEAGKIHFAARVAGIDGELVAQFVVVMTTGKIAGPVKNPNAIAKIGA